MLGVGMLLPLGDIRALSCVPPAPLCRGRHRFKLGSRQMTMLRSPRARPARPPWKRGAFQEARLSRFAVGARDLATDTESLGASECIWQLQRGVLCPATGPELVESQRHLPLRSRRPLTPGPRQPLLPRLLRVPHLRTGLVTPMKKDHLKYDRFHVQSQSSPHVRSHPQPFPSRKLLRASRRGGHSRDRLVMSYEDIPPLSPHSTLSPGWPGTD